MTRRKEHGKMAAHGSVVVTAEPRDNGPQTASSILEGAHAAFARNDLTSAERLCKRLLEVEPHSAAPWMILANVALRAQKPTDALTSAREAVAREPGNPLTHFVHCKTLIASTRFDDAAAALDEAVSTDRCSPALIDAIGVIYLQLKRFSSAQAMFERAVQAEPGNPQFLYNLAVSRRTSGALEDAERMFDQVIALRSDFHEAYFMRADVRTQTRTRHHVAQIEQQISSLGPASSRGVAALHYALGKELDDLGNYREAFRHFKAGAEAERGRLRYHVSGEVAVMDAIRATQTRRVLDSLAKRCNAESVTDNPIFIIGLPRSGTTLVDRIIGTQGHVFSAGELGTLPSQLIEATKRSGITREGAWVGKLGSLDFAALGRIYSKLAREMGVPPSMQFTDKYPPNGLLAGVIRIALPRAKIIALDRDPMDVCFSLYRTLFSPGVYPYSYSLQDLADYYVAFRRLLAHWRTTLGGDRYLEVSYEKLVLNLESESRRILDFLELPWDPKILRFHESRAPVTTASASQVRRPLYSSSVAHWKHYASELEPLRARLRQFLPTLGSLEGS